MPIVSKIKTGDATWLRDNSKGTKEPFVKAEVTNSQSKPTFDCWGCTLVYTPHAQAMHEFGGDGGARDTLGQRRR